MTTEYMPVETKEQTIEESFAEDFPNTWGKTKEDPRVTMHIPTC